MGVAVEYDKAGKMLYHPEFHKNHQKTLSEEELEYLCKFWESDHARTMAMALGRTERSLAQKVLSLRKKGLYEYYKNLNKHW